MDTITSQELEGELMESMDGVSSLIFDFSKLDYISSAGLRVLLAAHKAMSPCGEMKLIHVNEPVMDIFNVTGFTNFLNIE